MTFLQRLTAALLTLSALASPVCGQHTVASVPYNVSGASATAWTSRTYQQGEMATESGMLCVSRIFNNNTEPAVTPGNWACSAAPITLQTNGTANGSGSKLNLVQGQNVSIADDGAGDVTISAAEGAGTDALDSTGSINSLPVQEYSTFARPGMANWLAALHGCKYRVVNLAFLTDSYGMAALYNGAGPTDPNDRYITQVREYLQSICPSHGTGLHPWVQQLTNGTSYAQPDGRYYGSVNGGQATISSAIGPAQSLSGVTIGAVAQVPSGAAFIFSSIIDGIAYDTINSYCASGPGYGTWTVWKGDETISNSGATQIGTCGNSVDSSVTAHLSSISMGTSAAQTVTYVCSGGSPCLFYGAEGTQGTVGVSVHPLAMASSSAEIYNPASSFAFLDLIPGGINGLVTNYGTNEYPGGFSTSSFQNALQNIISHEQAQTTVPSVLMLTSPVTNPSGIASSAAEIPLYDAAEVALARADSGVNVANILDRWGTAYNPVYFGQSSDGTHPGDAGTLSEAAMLLEQLVDTAAIPPGGSAGVSGPVAATTLTASGATTLNGVLTVASGQFTNLWVIAPEVSTDPAGTPCSGNGDVAPYVGGNGGVSVCKAGVWTDVLIGTAANGVPAGVPMIGASQVNVSAASFNSSYALSSSDFVVNLTLSAVPTPSEYGLQQITFPSAWAKFPACSMNFIGDATLANSANHNAQTVYPYVTDASHVFIASDQYSPLAAGTYEVHVHCAIQ